MKHTEWYSPRPDDLGEVLREETAQDQRHKAYVIRSNRGLFMAYLYELTDSDVQEGRSHAIGWFRIEGPSTTDSLGTANTIVTEWLNRFNKNR